MIRFRTFVLIAAMALFAAGCDTAPVKGIKGMFQSKGDQALSTGIGQYEDGNYSEAAKSLQSALDQELAADSQVKAHKYLAFVHCLSGRERLCRDEFRKALDLNPAMELQPAEAGHPIWGPVFRSVKAKK